MFTYYFAHSPAESFAFERFLFILCKFYWVFSVFLRLHFCLCQY